MNTMVLLVGTIVLMLLDGTDTLTVRFAHEALLPAAFTMRLMMTWGLGGAACAAEGFGELPAALAKLAIR